MNYSKHKTVCADLYKDAIYLIQDTLTEEHSDFRKALTVLKNTLF